jgi:glutathione S-transferase
MITGEERTQMLESFQNAMGELAKAYRRTHGPFLEGDAPTYADFIVGSWLKFYKKTIEEWEQLLSWHDGLWGQLHRALEKYAEVK